MDIIEGSLDKFRKSIKIGVVTSRFNLPVTEKLEQGALTRLAELGIGDGQVYAVRVPGAVEIPFAAQLLLENGFDAIVALGAVIRGETSHFDYVCSSVERGCTELQLKYKRPIAFGVLTTENDDQAFARAGGDKGNKGIEAAEVALEMLSLKQKIKKLV